MLTQLMTTTMITTLDPSPAVTLAFGMPGATEWIIIGIVGLLIFGRRLPEVGRSLGRSIVEFKKGIKGIEDDIDDASSSPQGDDARPLRPYDKRLGGNEEELRRLNSQNAPAPAGAAHTGAPPSHTEPSTQ